ncbi:hypothetical protein CDL15_Pgr024257 [Punica granatum]|uniref:Uncharacterized protein n=1 Tax=Punica granatum TaxID=22663 RepID=A0A218XY51_PUNGR|nr:hypothetical protein CDL15_Pgr024257 [Punica granatum]
MDFSETNHHRLSRPIRCIVKLGGAAITCKNEIEKTNEEGLEIVASQLREAMVSGSSLPKGVGMDWSKRAECSEISLNVDDFGDQELMELSNFIVVHGAGSFGHFQASKSGVHKGGLERPLVKAGFVATRISVTKLNLEIVRALARANLSTVTKALDSGFVPVLHGDAVLDEAQTDVLGVYDRPPTEPGAVLLREIGEHPYNLPLIFLNWSIHFVVSTAVNEDGSWSVLKPRLKDSSRQVEITVAAHDTTGGMMTKISEAAMIAKLGIDVYIVKAKNFTSLLSLSLCYFEILPLETLVLLQATTNHSVRALRGELRGDVIPDDWLGTLVRFSR